MRVCELRGCELRGCVLRGCDLRGCAMSCDDFTLKRSTDSTLFRSNDSISLGKPWTEEG